MNTIEIRAGDITSVWRGARGTFSELDVLVIRSKDTTVAVIGSRDELDVLRVRIDAAMVTDRYIAP